MEFCLVIILTMGDNGAVTWPPITATRYVSFATSFKVGKKAGNTHISQDGGKYW